MHQLHYPHIGQKKMVLWGTLWESRDGRVYHSTMGKIMGNTSCWLFFFFFSVQLFPASHSLGHKQLQPRSGSTRKVNKGLNLSQGFFDLCEITGCVNSERTVVSSRAKRSWILCSGNPPFLYLSGAYWAPDWKIRLSVKFVIWNWLPDISGISPRVGEKSRQESRTQLTSTEPGWGVTYSKLFFSILPGTGDYHLRLRKVLSGANCSRGIKLSICFCHLRSMRMR